MLSTGSHRHDGITYHPFIA